MKVTWSTPSESQPPSQHMILSSSLVRRQAGRPVSTSLTTCSTGPARHQHTSQSPLPRPQLSPHPSLAVMPVADLLTFSAQPVDLFTTVLLDVRSDNAFQKHYWAKRRFFRREVGRVTVESANRIPEKGKTFNTVFYFISKLSNISVHCKERVGIKLFTFYHAMFGSVQHFAT